MRLIRFYRQRFAHYGHGSEKQAIVGLGGQAYIAGNSQDAKKEFRPDRGAVSTARASILAHDPPRKLACRDRLAVPGPCP